MNFYEHVMHFDDLNIRKFPRDGFSELCPKHTQEPVLLVVTTTAARITRLLFFAGCCGRPVVRDRVVKVCFAVSQVFF